MRRILLITPFIVLPIVIYIAYGLLGIDANEGDKQARRIAFAACVVAFFSLLVNGGTAFYKLVWEIGKANEEQKKKEDDKKERIEWKVHLHPVRHNTLALNIYNNGKVNVNVTSAEIVGEQNGKVQSAKLEFFDPVKQSRPQPQFFSDTTSTSIILQPTEDEDFFFQDYDAFNMWGVKSESVTMRITLRSGVTIDVPNEAIVPAIDRLRKK